MRCSLQTIARRTRARSTSCAVLIFALVAAAGCASVNVNHDYDPDFNFGSLKTFTIMPITPESGMNDLDAKRASGALRSELGAKGYQESSDADFSVALHFGRQQQIQVDSYGYGYGYGSRGGMGGVDVYQYTEGTLVIDFVYNATKSMIWRGTGQGVLDDTPNPEEKTAKINAAVAKIISQFPPG